MTTTQSDLRPHAQGGQEACMRVVYRDGGGAIHFDWPADRLPEAIEDKKGILWVDLQEPRPNGTSKTETLLRDVFHFHPLAVEDAVCETHLPKVDDWGEYLYLVFHSIEFDRESNCLRLHEVDIFLGPNYVVTFRNEPVHALDQLRRNLEREPANRLRHGADHVLYHILDLCVAEYMPAIERLDEVIDAAQDEVFKRPTTRTLRSIFQVKRSALRLHRILVPEREVLNRLARDDYDPIDPEHRIYFRDVYDHIVRIHDIAEGLRDLISGALDTYLSAVSNRTNEIMKALTLVTVMFLPMSFVTSFFGMNFFAENIVFHAPLPKALLFTASCLFMFVTPWAMYLWARRRRWF